MVRIIRRASRCMWVKASVWERVKCVSVWILSINIYFHPCISCFAAKYKTFIMSLSFTAMHFAVFLYPLSLKRASLHLIFHLTPGDPHIDAPTQRNLHCSFCNYPTRLVPRPKTWTWDCGKPCCPFPYCTGQKTSKFKQVVDGEGRVRRSCKKGTRQSSMLSFHMVWMHWAALFNFSGIIWEMYPTRSEHKNPLTPLTLPNWHILFFNFSPDQKCNFFSNA